MFAPMSRQGPRDASIRLLITALIALIGAVGLSGHARAADWSRVESDHFVITSDGPAGKAESYAQQVEAFRYVALMLLGADPVGTRTQSKFDIYLLRNQAQIRKVRPNFSDRVAGVYFPCDEGSLAYAALQDNWARDGSDEGLMILLHEYSHHLMFQSSPAYYPSWYVEGFAEYMSTAFIDDGQVSLGYPQPGRMRTLAQDRWMKFEKVLSPLALNSGDKAHDQRDVDNFYAQSWLLTHYMLNDSERTKRFNAYFARVGAGEDPVAAFEPSTGIPMSSLERVLKRYLEALPVITVRSKDIPNAIPKAQALPEETQEWLLNASLLRTCMAKAQGETVLAQLRTLASAPAGVSADLRLARDRAEILFGDAKAAIDDLQAHAANDEGSFDAHYLMGRALFLQAQGLQGDARVDLLSQAKQQFLKAYRLRKFDAANLYFLSYTLPGGGSNVNVVNAARGAHSLAPGIDSYAIHEALVDLQADQRDRALQALTPLVSNAHDQKRAEQMRAAVAAIRAEKSLAEVERVINGN